MRSVWSGVISFGLVNIPVGMYPATKENQVAFHLLHKKDCGRVKNQRICSQCGEVLDYDDLTKGYEYEKGEYVEISKEELAKVRPDKSDAIAIKGFVDINDIDPIFFDSPYYLTPGKHGEKAYALLREVLEKSGKAGIASFVFHSKEYLAAVRVKDHALLLNTMHFADEVREAEGVPDAKSDVDKDVLAMSLQLVESMSGEFDIEKYKDTYNETVLELINKKLAGKPVKTKKDAPQPTNVLDLMSKLKLSLEQSASSNGNGSHEPRRATKAKAKPATKTKTGSKKAPAKKTKLRLVA